MSNVLVTGGAGYIGSHTVKELILDGKYTPVVVDSLVTGHRASLDAVSKLTRKKIKFHGLDLSDTAGLKRIMKRERIEAVIHFAAHCYVGESVENPLKYYHNNVSKTISLLNAMVDCGVKKMVFSSSAAVYGDPKLKIIPEDTPQGPINPYGVTKSMMEQIMSDFDKAYGMRYAALRYFNAAGASPDSEIGEDHKPETHLIPLVLFAALGKRKDIKIFGTDYPTPDGTCVRDYIHIVDLADAHIRALKSLDKGTPSQFYNLGNGKGYSVKEVIDVARTVTGCDINAVEDKRRPGDPPYLVASSKKIVRILKWKRRFPKLQQIIKTAWDWHRNNPDGYKH